MKIELDRDEIRKRLKDHIQYLIDSCKSYDEGKTAEARRMAVTIRVLLHDTNNSTSLLKQLDKKDILFYDTAYEHDPNNMLTTTGLASIRIGGGVKYIPHLNDFSYGRGKIPFQEWWDQIVVVDKHGKELSRKKFVTTMANQDGGAHVDPKLDSDYYNATRGDSLGWTDLNGNPIEDIDLASIRQISFEVLKSLEDEFPEFFS